MNTKKSVKIDADKMRPEYDFSKGIKNPYASRFNKGNNIVMIDTDLFKVFPSENAVNDALRAYLRAGSPAAKVKTQRQAKAS